MNKYIEPLARHKLWSGRIVLIVGAVLVCAVNFQWWPINHVNPENPWIKLMSGAGTTFTIVGLLDLFPEWLRRRHEGKKRRRFCEFFGKAAVRDGIFLVTAQRTVSRTYLKYMCAPGAPSDWKGIERGENFMKVLPEGVHSWVAEQDIRAVSYLSKLFAEQGVKLTVRMDGEHVGAGLESPTIAIGLGFNAYTTRLAGISGVFRICDDHSPADHDLGITDQFEVAGRIPLPEKPQAEDGTYIEYCLLARVDHDEDRNVVHFVCAGRTADGTAAAGYFLLRSWDDLARRFGNRTFAVVIQFEVYVKPDETRPQRDLDRTAKIAADFDARVMEPGELAPVRRPPTQPLTSFAMEPPCSLATDAVGDNPNL